MIICGKCGNDNPLGRVFCGKCGGKLDFSHTSSADIAAKTQTKKFEGWGKPVTMVIVLIVLIPVALALWPKTTAIGKPASSGGDKRVEVGVKASSTIKKGQTGNIAFAEEDINAYFEQGKAKAAGFDTVRVSLLQGFFTAQAIRPLFQLPFKVKGNPFTVKMSFEVVCVPVKGGTVVVRKAAVGHLPMIGPMKAIAAGQFRKGADAQKDWTTFKSAAETKIDAGRVTFTIKP